MKIKQLIFNFLRDNNIEYSEVLGRFGFTTRQGFYKWLTNESKYDMHARKKEFETLKGEYE